MQEPIKYISYQTKKNLVYSLDAKLLLTERKYVRMITNYFKKLTSKIIRKDNNITSIELSDFKILRNMIQKLYKEVGKVTLIETNKELQTLTNTNNRINIIDNDEDILYKAEVLANKKLLDFQKFLIKNVQGLPADNKKEITNKIKASSKVYQNRHIRVTTQTIGTSRANDKRLEIFNKSSIVKGVEFIAILDKDTTKICRSRHGKKLKKDNPLIKTMYTPPLHYNCRSLLSPITIYEKNIKYNEINSLLAVEEQEFKYKEV